MSDFARITREPYIKIGEHHILKVDRHDCYTDDVYQGRTYWLTILNMQDRDNPKVVMHMHSDNPFTVQDVIEGSVKMLTGESILNREARAIVLNHCGVLRVDDYTFVLIQD